MNWQFSVLQLALAVLVLTLGLAVLTWWWLRQRQKHAALAPLHLTNEQERRIRFSRRRQRLRLRIPATLVRSDVVGSAADELARTQYQGYLPHVAVNGRGARARYVITLQKMEAVQ